MPVAIQCSWGRQLTAVMDSFSPELGCNTAVTVTVVSWLVRTSLLASALLVDTASAITKPFWIASWILYFLLLSVSTYRPLLLSVNTGYVD